MRPSGASRRIVAWASPRVAPRVTIATGRTARRRGGRTGSRTSPAARTPAPAGRATVRPRRSSARPAACGTDSPKNTTSGLSRSPRRPGTAAGGSRRPRRRAAPRPRRGGSRPPPPRSPGSPRAAGSRSAPGRSPQFRQTTRSRLPCSSSDVARARGLVQPVDVLGDDPRGAPAAAARPPPGARRWARPRRTGASRRSCGPSSGDGCRRSATNSPYVIGVTRRLPSGPR